ncbi:hypothetical protein I8G32_01573 [Rhodopseudomonas palustris]|uniref:Uncharacterized protein n=1 Tax=Rhodopseudomonas palustris (strain ATCC BAA-98 / CGA009) TaxID=258594 RepID=Q6N9K8_RHOPA|nr:hypothetical protein [Rhodopseudomonas palustris]OPF91242.1 hypothetical protein B1S06_17190 [Rhodopseudomonas palustris]QQM03036.1 hypothetical protein I8G32_01573 [Rhodopseudomonas palustris]RJF60598.1 hypothetical protein D4Q71_24215 [Rhodopseudomonas palustris]WAB79207.1 hypothetical protein OR798_07895 [Rhodopseudomonas palustris]WCL91675.1 hypothetical protein TX73_007890 [Rhodopseudomonas palustris CGA009]
MQMMSELFASGTVVDAVLIFLLVEAIGVIGYWLWRKHGIAPADFLPGMISGALMLLALRAVLAGAGWMVPTLCLLAAGGAHLVDVLRRWR